MRLKILQEAMELVEKNGINFQMEDLAHRLRISKRTVYEHFSSKQELIDAVINYIFSEMEAGDKNIATSEDSSTADKLKNVLLNFPIGINSFNIIGIITDIKQKYPHSWRIIDDHIQASWDSALFLINEGIETGEFRNVNPIMIKEILNVCMRDLLDYRFLIKNNITFEHAFGTLCDVVVNGITS